MSACMREFCNERGGGGGAGQPLNVGLLHACIHEYRAFLACLVVEFPEVRPPHAAVMAVHACFELLSECMHDAAYVTGHFAQGSLCLKCRVERSAMASSLEGKEEVVAGILGAFISMHACRCLMRIIIVL